MMAIQETLPLNSLNLFTASKQIRFLESLKKLRFSGELGLTSPQGERWNFYLYLGSIIYATGGIHPMRRWQRNLATYCPQLSTNSLAGQKNLTQINSTSCSICWEYQLLYLWVEQQKISLEQVTKLIQAAILEVLFDVAQGMRATYQIKQDKSLSKPLVLIDVEQAIARAQNLWQAWQQENLINYSPNSAPVIKQPAHLKNRTSPQAYQTLTHLLNGKRTLRDVALLMKRDVLQVTRSLLAFLQSGLIELVTIPDLPVPIDAAIPKKPSHTEASSGYLVACVDDSPLVCQTLEALLTGAGYRFVGVQDGLRAIATILTRKPDAIFLDLVMPHTNGYEICAQLRKVPSFRTTPILILTGNDGIVDRVRAKLVGASDFLSKPVDAEMVLSILRKHLEQGAQRLES
ncbi:MAG TPA: response regulator [Cyanophyceae cyanobacterium]